MCKILVEWKKPFDGRSEITNYIILYYESFNKKWYKRKYLRKSN